MQTISDQRISEIAGAAADGLEANGHIKDHLGHKGGPMCALGALGYGVCGDPTLATSFFYRTIFEGEDVTRHTPDDLLVFGVVAQALKDALEGLLTVAPPSWVINDDESGRFNTIAAWNNDPERTAGEVIAALRQVQSEYAMRTYAPNLVELVVR